MVDGGFFLIAVVSDANMFTILENQMVGFKNDFTLIGIVESPRNHDALTESF